MDIIPELDNEAFDKYMLDRRYSIRQEYITHETEDGASKLIGNCYWVVASYKGRDVARSYFQFAN